MDQMDQHWVNVDAGGKKAVEELGNVDSVSYTHLDVYKRQPSSTALNVKLGAAISVLNWRPPPVA